MFSKLEQLREKILRHERGHEVEVKPTGEILIPDDLEEENLPLSNDPPIRVSRMSPHTFGTVLCINKFQSLVNFKLCQHI